MGKFLIVGLGNPGVEYAHTRHNIGFDVLNEWVKKREGLFHIARLAEVVELKWKGHLIICVKPTTYMNLSGKAFKYWLDAEKIAIGNTLTVVDDLALPLSRLRIRPSGSDAGHNGLKSIQETLGSDAYPKLRFGIGNDFPKGRQVEFVLGKWSDAEWPLVSRKIEKSLEVIDSFILRGIGHTMNEYNKLDITL